MAIEDFLGAHGPETTGTALPVESAANLDLTMLVKMASNGMPLALDLAAPETAAALERGKRSFYRRVGQRNHACADCHTTEGGKGADKFLGGRVLANVEVGLTRHFPTWRTSQARVGHAQADAVVHDAARREHARGGCRRVRGARALPRVVRRGQAPRRARDPTLSVPCP